MIEYKALRALNPLFAGQQAGIYTLPADLCDLRAALDRLRSSEPAPPGRLGDVDNELTRAAVAAAKAGQALPDLGVAYAEAADTHAVYAHATRIWQQAVNRLASEVNNTAADLAETILVDHLRPAHDAIVEAARKDAQTFIEHGARPDAREMLTAPDRMRKAYLAMAAHHERYAAIHTARAKLTPLGYRGEHDEHGDFAMIRNPGDFYDLRIRQFRQHPWPPDPAAAFIWQLQHDAQHWLPTPDERDAAWWAVFGEDVERTKQGRQALGASRAAFG